MLEQLSFNPQLDYGALSAALLPIAAVIILVGFWASVAHATSGRDYLMAIVKIIGIVAAMVQFDAFCIHAQDYVDLIIDQIGAHPDKVSTKFLDTILQQRGEDDPNETSWFRKIFSPRITMAEAIVAALLFLASLIAAVLLFLAYLFQKLLLQAGYGVAVLFLSFVMLPATRSIGVHFVLAMAGVILWPLGWAIASLVTDALITYATNQSFFVDAESQGGWLYAFRNLLGGLVLALWIVISTFAAPWCIQKAITTSVFSFRR